MFRFCIFCIFCIFYIFCIFCIFCIPLIIRLLLSSFFPKTDHIVGLSVVHFISLCICICLCVWLYVFLCVCVCICTFYDPACCISYSASLFIIFSKIYHIIHVGVPGSPFICLCFCICLSRGLIGLLTKMAKKTFWPIIWLPGGVSGQKMWL